MACDDAFPVDEQSTSNIGRLNSECGPALKIKPSRRNCTVAHSQESSQDTLKCRYCHYNTNLKRKLTLHMKIHKRDKLYVCTLCRKSYTQSSSLVVHMRSHTGERPYVCSICGKCFAHSSSFYLHKNVHNEDRPYKCSLCEKAFKFSHHVKTHMNVHKKDSNKLKFLATYGLALEEKPE
uniref:C2H2-type domain-containing protein n=1 Tax=Eptatretus burgeri TaxID=7764 RepID=A0A8C4R5P4_EPTBU